MTDKTIPIRLRWADGRESIGETEEADSVHRYDGIARYFHKTDEVDQEGRTIYVEELSD